MVELQAESQRFCQQLILEERKRVGRSKRHIFLSVTRVVTKKGSTEEIRANYHLLISSEKKERKSKGNVDMFFIQVAVVGYLGKLPFTIIDRENKNEDVL
jgi:hypothetical protein